MSWAACTNFPGKIFGASVLGFQIRISLAPPSVVVGWYSHCPPLPPTLQLGHASDHGAEVVQHSYVSLVLKQQRCHFRQGWK